MIDELNFSSPESVEEDRRQEKGFACTEVEHENFFHLNSLNLQSNLVQWVSCDNLMNITNSVYILDTHDSKKRMALSVYLMIMKGTIEWSMVQASVRYSFSCIMSE